MLLIIPIFSFAHNPWEKEDKIAQKIKNIKNTAQLVHAIEVYHFDDNWSRVRVAFQWINTNIKYDWQKYRGTKSVRYTPDETISKRKGVCSEYASLFKDVLEQMCFETEIITGYAKGYGYQPGDWFFETNHAWNAIKDESGNWHCLM